MFGVGTPELIIILVIILMVFGVGKLPQVAKMLGSGVKSFKQGLNDDEADSKSARKSEPELLDADRSVEAETKEPDKASKQAW